MADNDDKKQDTDENLKETELEDAAHEGEKKEELQNEATSSDSSTDLHNTCTGGTTKDVSPEESECGSCSDSGTYIDLRHSKSEKYSIQAEDNVEKMSIQATDSCVNTQEQKYSSKSLSDICQSQESEGASGDSSKENTKSDDMKFDRLLKEENKSSSGAVGDSHDDKNFVEASEVHSGSDEEEDSGEEGDYESAEEGDANEEELKAQEEKLTQEEKEDRRKEAQVHKEEGNTLFKAQNYKEAGRCYTRALWKCPLGFPKDRAIMYSNRAACKLKLDNNEDAIKDCTKAVDLHPNYIRPLLRRAELYEKVEKHEEALADYQKVVELDPSQHAARAACMRLPEEIKERNEKMKAEMLSKLKDLGNMVLKPFGLSTNNFQLQQDPNTGGYSVNFTQSPPTNNS